LELVDLVWLVPLWDLCNGKEKETEGEDEEVPEPGREKGDWEVRLL